MNTTKTITDTKCTICRNRDGKRDQINEMLSKSVSHAEISRATGVPARTVSNHALHIGDIIEAAKEKQILTQAVDVNAEFAEQLEFAKRLRKAAQGWLTCPNNPDEFTLIPRSDEIEVIYWDRNSPDEDGNPTRRREPLQSVLDRLDEKGFKTFQIFTKHADLRDISLKTLDRCDTAIDKFARLAALYPKPQDTELMERILLLETMLKK